MPRPRSEQICLEVTSHFHLVSRCVRRAFLAGEDKFTGKNFDHRKQWIEDRILLLTNVFCIDVAAYAVMSNHFHVITKSLANKAKQFSERSDRTLASFVSG